MPRMGIPRMIAFGTGYMANMVKNRALTTFLMIFYSQVMGLPAAWVGLGAGLALVFDAVVDPAIGWISDHTRTRWGRRHPYMYLAAVPMGVLFFLLWNPPAGLGHEQLFAYMMVCLLSIRFFDTFFELPSSALVPEIVEDYDRRTMLFSARIVMGTIGSMLMMIFAYRIAMREGPDGTGGVLAREGYLSFGLVGGLLIFSVILIASISTHRYIPWLKQAADTERMGQRIGKFAEIGQTLGRRSFVTIAISGMLVSFAGSLTMGLALYVTLFFWGLDQAQLSVMAAGVAIAAVLGAGSATWFSRRMGKRNAAILGYVVGAAAEMTPYALRFAGILPENGHPAVFPTVLAANFINLTAWSMTGTLLTALVADIVEDAALTTRRKSAGLLFSIDQLFKKVSSAGGPAVAGLLLTLVAFPVGAKPGEVPPAVLDRMIVTYLVVLLCVYVVSIAALAMYNITRQTHQANLEELKRRQVEANPEPLPAE